MSKNWSSKKKQIDRSDYIDQKFYSIMDNRSYNFNYYYPDNYKDNPYIGDNATPIDFFKIEDEELLKYQLTEILTPRDTEYFDIIYSNKSRIKELINFGHLGFDIYDDDLYNRYNNFCKSRNIIPDDLSKVDPTTLNNYYKNKYSFLFIKEISDKIIVSSYNVGNEYSSFIYAFRFRYYFPYNMPVITPKDIKVAITAVRQKFMNHIVVHAVNTLYTYPDCNNNYISSEISHIDFIVSNAKISNNNKYYKQSTVNSMLPYAITSVMSNISGAYSRFSH